MLRRKGSYLRFCVLQISDPNIDIHCKIMHNISLFIGYCYYKICTFSIKLGDSNGDLHGRMWLHRERGSHTGIPGPHIRVHDWTCAEPARIWWALCVLLKYFYLLLFTVEVLLSS